MGIGIVSFLLQTFVGSRALKVFGLGGTMSNFLGQLVVQHFGHVASLMGSLGISFVPIILFGLFMPETHGQRGLLDEKKAESARNKNATFVPAESDDQYVQMT